MRVGARGHFGIYSFGRGKAISGVGGGAISVNQLLPEERAAEFIIALGDIEAASRRSFTGVKDLLVGVLQYYFSMPLLYKIPLSLPFLKLGETNCKMHISKCKISEVQILFALAQLKDMEKNAAVFKNNSDLWCKALRERAANVFMFRASNEDCLTRLAILLPANESKRIFESKFRNYGLSASYPQTLVNYKELAGFIEHKELPESEKCSAQLFTLPLHRFVTPELIDEVVGMIGS